MNCRKAGRLGSWERCVKQSQEQHHQKVMKAITAMIYPEILPLFLRNGYRIRVQILRGTKRDNNWNADYTDDADLRG